jgi:hypothetical protein
MDDLIKQLTKQLGVSKDQARGGVVALLRAGQQNLAPKDFAEFVRDVPGALTVPPAALLRDGSDPTKAQTYVVVNNKVERRDVLVGVEVPDAVQVASGLKAGEVVVVDPPSALGPGTQVQVERDTKAGS